MVTFSAAPCTWYTVTGNVTVDFPAGTSTLSGTDATVRSLLERKITAPPSGVSGAGAERVMVPSAFWLLRTAAGSIFIAVSVGHFGHIVGMWNAASNASKCTLAMLGATSIAILYSPPPASTGLASTRQESLGAQVARVFRPGPSRFPAEPAGVIATSNFLHPLATWAGAPGETLLDFGSTPVSI